MSEPVAAGQEEFQPTSIIKSVYVSVAAMAVVRWCVTLIINGEGVTNNIMYRCSEDRMC